MKKLILLALLMAVNLYAEPQAYTVKLSNKKDIAKLSRLCSIECAQKDGTLFIYAEDSELESIKPYLSSIEPKAKVIATNFKSAKTLAELTANWDAYPSLSVYSGYLKKLENESNGFIELDTIGVSSMGRPLIYIHFISAIKRAKPKVLYSSSIHGDELTGCIMLLRLAELFSQNYQKESVEGARITKLIDSLDVWLMPMNNPDGTYPKSDTTVANAKRTNKNGKDLNRNFPDFFADPINTTVGREPETAAIMDFYVDKNFTLSANFHTGAVLVNYPWDGLEDLSDSYILHNCPDSVWFKQISKLYADNNSDMKNSTEFENGITNGSEWYPIYGGRQDWMYAFNYGRETTIELSMNGILSPNELIRQWTINKESLLQYLEAATRGIHGIVRDSKGNLIDAKIHLAEIPETDVITTKGTGYFTRLVAPAIYNIEIIADNYEPYLIPNVNMIDTNYRFLDITLPETKSNVASGTQEIDFSFDKGLFKVPNNINSANSQLCVYNILGNTIWNSNPTNSSTIVFEDYNNLPAGAYFAKLICGNKTGVIKFLKH